MKTILITTLSLVLTPALSRPFFPPINIPSISSDLDKIVSLFAKNAAVANEHATNAIQSTVDNFAHAGAKVNEHFEKKAADVVDAIANIPRAIQESVDGAANVGAKVNENILSSVQDSIDAAAAAGAQANESVVKHFEQKADLLKGLMHSPAMVAMHNAFTGGNQEEDMRNKQEDIAIPGRSARETGEVDEDALHEQSVDSTFSDEYDGKNKTVETAPVPIPAPNQLYRVSTKNGQRCKRKFLQLAA